MKYCFKCGNQLPDEAAFCSVCGARQPESPAPADTPAPAPAYAAPAPEPVQVDPVPYEPRRQTAAGTDGSDPFVSKNVLLCTDGKYRWVYELGLFKDMWVFWTILKIFGGVILGGMLIFLIIEVFGDHNYGDVLKMGLIMGAIFLGLSILGYLVYALMMGGKYCVIFTMDEEGIVHEQQAKQAKKASIVGDLLVLAGAATGNLTTVGIGLTSGNRNAMYTAFKGTKKITGIRRKNTIVLREGLSNNRIWCEAEDFEFVWNYILPRCTGAQVIQK
ncbi:MAG: zinc ribbon domain-containing protein [Lachnospiraceae bacterium]|nr:zinc ribbon domain-containing protein [Lachnospiraceae bacterium]